MDSSNENDFVEVEDMDVGKIIEKMRKMEVNKFSEFILNSN